MTEQQNLFGPLEIKRKPSDPSGTVPVGQAHLIRVAFENAGDNLFDYALPEKLENAVQVGQRIRAPLGRGNRPAVGFCVERPEKSSVQKVKTITDIVDPQPLLDEQMMRLAQWIQRYYCCGLGTVLSAMVPAAVKRQVGMKERQYVRLQGKEDEGSCTSRLSKQGKEILSFLGRQAGQTDRFLAVDDLIEQIPCSKASLSTLVRRGLLERISKRELPAPENLFSSYALEQPATWDMNDDQRTVLSQIEPLLDQPGFHAILLHGVTGSGKTEIYIRCIEKAVRQGKQGLVLVPEIALTPQTVSRFLSRFKRVAILHSGLTSLQRHQFWRWIAEGHVDVVIGARSAVFAPLTRLGIVVVDEEHEPGYKQDKAPRYHGRDVAIKRAQLQQIPVLLGSATPSLESWSNCRQREHYHLCQLPSRVMDLPLPKVVTVDMRKEFTSGKHTHILSRLLKQEMELCLQRKKQTILLLNRRGHSGYIFCPRCQFVLTCPNCDINLTRHRLRDALKPDVQSWVMCHHCQHSSRIPPGCPLCGKPWVLLKPGTQKAEDQIQQTFPEAKIHRVDSDSVNARQLQQVLNEFRLGHIDILLGTQMVGKGLDFPNVDLVGVLNADTALNLPDFRSSERTFQLIAQVAGRCGRACATGKVIVQSYLPSDPAIVLACEHDYERFAEYEMRLRSRCLMPPYRRLARIILRSPKWDTLQQCAQQLATSMKQVKEELGLPLEIRGPAPAVIARLEQDHRMEILIKGTRSNDIQTLLEQLRRKNLFGLSVQVQVDVDPMNMF